MNYVDIVIIALIALFALLGLWKGFGKTGIKLICFAVALLVTWLVADKVAGLILNVGFLQKFIVGDSASLAAMYSKGLENFFDVEKYEFTGVVGYFINPILKNCKSVEGLVSYLIDPVKFASQMFAINTLNVVLCLVVYGIVRIIAILFSKLLRKLFINDDGEVRVWSRLVGFLFGGVRGAALAMVLVIVSSVIFPFKFAEPYTKSASEGIISKFTVEQTYKLYDKALYGKDNLDKLFEKAGLTEEAE